MSLLGPLLPPSVRVVERFGGPPGRRERTRTGRDLARHALGDPAAVIGRGPRGEPVWPEGVVGSITHTDGYAAVALASRVAFSSVGIDAEPLTVLPPETVPVVTTWAELEALHPLAGDLAPLLAFVAKEAVFKAWFPLTGTELDFAEVRLSVAGEGGLDARRADGRRPGHGALAQPWRVRWRVAEGLLFAAVTVPPK